MMKRDFALRAAITLVVLLLVGISPLAIAAPNIIVGQDTIAAGETAEIPMTLQADGVVVAADFRFDFDETQFTPTIDCNGSVPTTGAFNAPIKCAIVDGGGGDLHVAVLIGPVISFPVPPFASGDLDLGSIFFEHTGDSSGSYPLTIFDENYFDASISPVTPTASSDGAIVVERARGNRPVKTLVCHVGNDVGPNGETYLDDPYCAPNDLNDYFCPSAGKIDLISVPEHVATKHLENPNHYWDGTSDYDPIAEGASGEGTEDSDGNGVDDGCELISPCPCWSESELEAVTADNYEGGCGLALSTYIENELGSTPGVEGGFSVFAIGSYRSCFTRDFGINKDITIAEHQICLDQILARCATILQ
jgi:hypothetical protein